MSFVLLKPPEINGDINQRFVYENEAAPTAVHLQTSSENV